MDRKAQDAIETIRECLAGDRYIALQHFVDRISERGLVWADVLTIFDDPSDARADGTDDWDRARWIVSGRIATGETGSVVCVLDRNDDGELVVLVTMYWGR